MDPYNTSQLDVDEDGQVSVSLHSVEDGTEATEAVMLNDESGGSGSGGELEDQQRLVEEAGPPAPEKSVGFLETSVPAKMSSTGRKSLHHIKFNDHFSLKSPSSEIRFRNANVHVFEQKNSQFLLEENPPSPDDDDDGDGRFSLTAKLARDGSVGLMFLRAIKTLIAFLMAGFLFIFCVQIILFLFLDLSVDSGVTSSQSFDMGKFLATLFSIPVFVYGLASALTIAASFIADTWSGHAFIKMIARWRDVLTEWISFIIFLCVPLFMMMITLFAKSDDWWKISAITWFSCIFAAYFFFAVAVIYFEVAGCLELVRFHPLFEKEGYDNDSVYHLIKRTIYIRQVEKYSGVKRRMYIVTNQHELPAVGTRSKSERHSYDNEKISLYSRMTQWQCVRSCGLFKDMDEPMRKTTIDEAREQTPFLTANSWSLEKFYCRNRNAPIVAIVNGPSAITPFQARSSFACAIIGNTLIILLIIALLVWFDLNGAVIAIIFIVLLILMIPMIISLVRNFKAYRSIMEEAKKANNESEAIHQVRETYRITKASGKLCWIMFVLEVGIFFIWPLVSLFVIGNGAIAGLFVVIGFVSAIRHYFNAAEILKEVGSLDYLEANNAKGSQRDLGYDWREKSRLSAVIGKISQGRRLNIWLIVFSIIIVLFCVVFIGAYAIGTDDGDTATAELLDDFYYEEQPNLPYPTCKIGKGVEIPGVTEAALADYTYLASVAYVSSNSIDTWLNGWFGDGNAIDKQELVDEFRAYYNEGKESPVTYKLIEFPPLPDFAVVSVRGTHTGFDALADAQLWLAAMLAQLVREVLPIGSIWTPILENLVKMVSIVESDSLQEVAYYKETTAFVNWLRDENHYSTVQITGHSLGGGIAMITGAQTHIPSVALSGPNSMLSRLTYDPPVSKDELNTYTFNIVPDRDIVPMFDDKAELYQRIFCRAALNNPIDCHTSLRSLCEIVYRCGTGPRPALCWCSRDYGYPEPIANGTRTFDEACPK